jgi:hypothetical protein
MKNMFVVTLFMLATVAWAAAQQPGSASERSSGRTTSPSSQAPSPTQSQPSTPGSADQSGSGDQEPNVAVTEGCLGGSNPNYTITDKTGTTYKLNFPPNADASKLASHVGESVQVMGNVKDTGKAGNASIDVRGVGRGAGKCPASDSKGAQPPQKK